MRFFFLTISLNLVKQVNLITFQPNSLISSNFKLNNVKIALK
jgi:hypothetical protein